MDTTEGTNVTGTSLRAEPLKSKRKTGELYQRLEVVESEIIKLNGMPESERVAEIKRARPETIFHFIRKDGPRHEAMQSLLCKELSRRITNTVRRRLAGNPKELVEDIAMKVDLDIMEILLSRQQGRKADFLEVNFYAAVEGPVLNALSTYRRSVMDGKRDWIQTDEVDEEGDAIERTIELVPGNEPGPQENTLIAEDKRLLQRAIELARAEVPDPRHLQAVILYYLEEWPVTSIDPEVASLVTYFRVSERTIRHWLSRTLEVLHRILTALKNKEAQ